MLNNLTRAQWLMSLGAALGLAQSKSETKQLTAEDLEKALENEKNLFFLDVREPKEIEELGTIKGYVNIPVSQLEKRLAEIPKDKVIITA
ncbi:MAG: rhodanese-like domain-containing protein [Bryobacteraceae bacterium]|nr:rhodanese-like domain-containing protein [Bryobacteraceae bacterium]